MKYFVILSEGAYSDYDPNYYFGDKEITKEELNKKSYSVGDKLMEEYLSLPERKDTSGYTFSGNDTERFNPITNEKVYEPSGTEFIAIMEKWLMGEMNYEKVPEDCPEVNCYYDIPTSKNKDEDQYGD